MGLFGETTVHSSFEMGFEGGGGATTDLAVIAPCGLVQKWKKHIERVEETGINVDGAVHLCGWHLPEAELGR